METRKAKVNISSAGGTAAKGAKTYKVTLPTAWMNAMGIDGSQRLLDLSFDGNQILIPRSLPFDDFVKQKLDLKHDVRVYNYYDSDTLCSTICADFTEKNVSIVNHVNNQIKTAFGNNKSPTWQQFLDFLEGRCIPRGRDGLREYLETLGLCEYAPLSIISKTSGRVAEDNQWLEEVK